MLTLIKYLLILSNIIDKALSILLFSNRNKYPSSFSTLRNRSKNV
jgi:hypothetical protein